MKTFINLQYKTKSKLQNSHPELQNTKNSSSPSLQIYKQKVLLGNDFQVLKDSLKS